MAGILSSFLGGAVGGASVEIIIKAIDAYSADLAKAQRELAKTGQVTSKYGSLTKVAMTAAGGAIFAATTATVAFATKSIQAFSEAEQVINRTKGVWGGLSDEIKFISGNMSRSSIETTEGIMDGFNRLGVVLRGTGVTFSQQQKLVQTALNLSAVTGKEFNEVINDLAQGLNGNNKSLKEYGIILNEDMSFQDAFNKIIKETTQFQGAGERQNNSTKGSWEGLKESIGNLVQVVGEKLAPAFNTAMGVMKSGVDSLKESVAGVDVGKFTLKVEINGGAEGILNFEKTGEKSNKVVKDMKYYIDQGNKGFKGLNISVNNTEGALFDFDKAARDTNSVFIELEGGGRQLVSINDIMTNSFGASNNALKERNFTMQGAIVNAQLMSSSGQKETEIIKGTTASLEENTKERERNLESMKKQKEGVEILTHAMALMTPKAQAYFEEQLIFEHNESRARSQTASMNQIAAGRGDFGGGTNLGIISRTHHTGGAVQSTGQYQLLRGERVMPASQSAGATSVSVIIQGNVFARDIDEFVDLVDEKIARKLATKIAI